MNSTKLGEEHIQLQSQHDKLNGEYQQLRDEHTRLQSQHRALDRDHSKLRTAYEKAKGEQDQGHVQAQKLKDDIWKVLGRGAH